MAKKKSVERERNVYNGFKPKTQGQSEYARTIAENTVTFATGPAGTGKSYCAMALACQYMIEGRYDRIVIARPTVEASPKGIGFIPGDIDAKMYPYVKPAIAHMKKMLGADEYRIRADRGDITFAPLEYMRGETFDYSFMILEEAQNCTVEQLKMFVTRIGDESKIVVNGDTDQTDLRIHDGITDLEYVISKVDRLRNFAHVQLTESDIVRNKIIVDFLRAMK